MIKITRSIGRPTAIEEAMAIWAVQVAEEMKDEQIAKDFVASGKSLRMYEVLIAKPNLVELVWAAYLRFSLESVGRRPGSYPPINEIVKWLKKKGIKPEEGTSLNALAFLISRKMAKFGNLVFRKKRSGIDLIDIINHSFRMVDDEMAMKVAVESADYLVKQYYKK